jgi:hypothetical protein
MATPEQTNSYNADIPRYFSQANRLNHFNPDPWVWWLAADLREKVFPRTGSWPRVENPSR